MDLLFTAALYAVFAALLALVIVCVIVLAISTPYPEITDVVSERSFKDGAQQQPFPSLLTDPPSITLSVVVPAYNEEERLPTMLDECLEYLEDRNCKKSNFSYEVLVVDDGSSDSTTDVAHRYSSKLGAEKVRCLTLARNRGKGGAVRLGMLRCRGAALLFADADGASKFEDYAKLEDALNGLCKEESDLSASLGVVCGSRAHLEEESVAQRSLFRTVLMYGFHALVWLFTVRGIKDTQCGFKLMTRRTAKILFQSLHIERWAFDVELLMIAQQLGIPIAEVAVRWTEIEGSKVTPVLSWLQMGRDLVLIWLRYTIGAWRIRAQI